MDARNARHGAWTHLTVMSCSAARSESGAVPGLAVWKRWTSTQAPSTYVARNQVLLLHAALRRFDGELHDVEPGLLGETHVLRIVIGLVLERKRQARLRVLAHRRLVDEHPQRHVAARAAQRVVHRLDVVARLLASDDPVLAREDDPEIRAGQRERPLGRGIDDVGSGRVPRRPERGGERTR